MIKRHANFVVLLGETFVHHYGAKVFPIDGALSRQAQILAKATQLGLQIGRKIACVQGIINLLESHDALFTSIDLAKNILKILHLGL